MSPNLLQPLQILPQFAFHTVSQDLRVLAIHNVSLSIEKPGRNFVLGWVIDDGHNPLEFFRCDFSGSGANKFLKCQPLELSGVERMRLLEGLESHNRVKGGRAHRLFRSTSAFLQTRLEYRRPTPLILVSAYMIFCLPSTLVLRRRRMNWKFDFSPETSAMKGKVLAHHSNFHNLILDCLILTHDE